jgi:hypothetical protein
MKAVSIGITVQQLGFRHTAADGIPGDPFVVVPFLLLGFAGHANGFMIIDGQNAVIRLFQAGVAPMARQCTR